MSGCGRCGTVKAVDGRDIKCKGARQVEIKIRGVRVKVEAILMNRNIDGIDVIIKMDVINEMGGVTIKEAEVKFGDVQNMWKRQKIIPTTKKRSCYMCETSSTTKPEVVAQFVNEMRALIQEMKTISY